MVAGMYPIGTPAVGSTRDGALKEHASWSPCAFASIRSNAVQRMTLQPTHCFALASDEGAWQAFRLSHFRDSSGMS